MAHGSASRRFLLALRRLQFALALLFRTLGAGLAHRAPEFVAMAMGGF